MRTLEPAGPRLLAFAATVGITALVACHDSTAPSTIATPEDPLTELAAANVLDARIVVHAHGSVFELPSYHAPARFTKTGKIGLWEAAGTFAADSPTVDPRSARPVKQGSPGPTASARRRVATSQRLRDMGFVNGKHYTVLSIQSPDSASGRPPRLEVIFTDGKPLLAFRPEYKRIQGAWTMIANSVIAFDSLGQQLATVRLDVRNVPGAPANSVRRTGFLTPGRTLGRTVVAAADAIASTVGGLLVPNAYAAGADGPCSALAAAAGAAAIAAAAAETAVIVAWAACLEGAILICLEIPELEAAAAAYAAWKQCVQTNCGDELARVPSGGDPSVHLRLAVPKLELMSGGLGVASLDVGHLNRGGHWINQTVHLPSKLVTASNP